MLLKLQSAACRWFHPWVLHVHIVRWCTDWNGGFSQQADRRPHFRSGVWMLWSKLRTRDRKATDCRSELGGRKAEPNVKWFWPLEALTQVFIRCVVKGLAADAAGFSQSSLMSRGVLADLGSVSGLS